MMQNMFHTYIFIDIVERHNDCYECNFTVFTCYSVLFVKVSDFIRHHLEAGIQKRQLANKSTKSEFDRQLPISR